MRLSGCWINVCQVIWKGKNIFDDSSKFKGLGVREFGRTPTIWKIEGSFGKLENKFGKLKGKSQWGYHGYALEYELVPGNRWGCRP